MGLLRSIKLGLIAMVPNLLPIATIMSIMSVTDIPIDMNTLLIASISIGLAVDDTIHLLHHFKVNYEATGNLELALQESHVPLRAGHHQYVGHSDPWLLLLHGCRYAQCF